VGRCAGWALITQGVKPQSPSVRPPPLSTPGSHLKNVTASVSIRIPARACTVDRSVTRCRVPQDRVCQLVSSCLRIAAPRFLDSRDAPPSAIRSELRSH